MVVNLIVLFAFLAMIFWGFGDFFIQRTVRKIPYLQALAWIGIIGTIGLLPFVFKDLNSLLNPVNAILILGLGVLAFVSAVFDFKALKEGKLSVVDVVIEAELPITIAISMIFLKEVLTSMQIVVISSIFIGILLTAIKSFTHLKFRIEKGVILALIAAAFFGVLNVLIGFSSKMLSPMFVIWGSWVLFTVFSLIVIAWQGDLRSMFTKGSKHKKLILVTSVIDLLAWVFYAYALENSGVSVVTAITESYPAVALFLGVMLNREKVKPHQYAGAVIAIACSVLLSMTIN